MGADNRRMQGFTLVELAIVMIIIGLLIGGVLKGQQLVENAKVKSVIAQIQAFEAAHNSFKDTYSAIAGDMANAAQRISGCETGNANNCRAGNGNGLVGNQIIPWDGSQYAITTEPTQFWKHLSLANLITGVSQNAAAPIWGESHPAARLRGGFNVFQGLVTADVASMDGLVLRLQSCLTCANVETGNSGMENGDAPAAPREAAQIDRKLDDGLPGSGYVRSSVAGGGQGCEVAYDEKIVKKSCIMYFKID